MKNKFLFVLALLSVLTMAGCKDKKDNSVSVLSAPQEITVLSNGEQSLIVFDEVDNAQYYNIYINDVCVTVKGNGTGTIQFDASKIITLPQKYTIKIQAGGDKYFDSDFTEEYEYNHTKVLSAPVATIDGTILNWDKVPNAEFYDVLVTSNNPSMPTMETTYRFAINKFNFSNILANEGEYIFKVRAVSESGEYSSSVYSNQITYRHITTLVTPHNIHVEYSKEANEYLLSFVSSDNVDSFTININGFSYNLTESEKEAFLYNPYESEYGNVYTIKLETFASSKEVNLDSSTISNISIKANTSNAYRRSSEFSKTVSFKFTSVLVTPRVELSTDGENCIIDIISNNDGSRYLSGFAIYLNETKYKTVNSSITRIELPLTDEVQDATIRVQAISNNSNCYSSNLSDAKHLNIKPLVSVKEMTYEDGIISWVCEGEASLFYIEITNPTFRYVATVEDTYLDLSAECPGGEYWVRICPIAQGNAQKPFQEEIIHTVKLSTPTQIEISSSNNGTYLYFDEVEGAYGYVVYLNDTPIKHLFSSSPINLSEYINEVNAYNVQLQAVGTINKGVVGSDLTEKKLIQSTRTLTAPALSIVREGDRYFLNVYINETETQVMDSCEIWVNYQSVAVIGATELQSGRTKVDVTSCFTNAGQYSFMAKLKAIDNPYMKDSNMASIVYNCVKQLDTVTDIKVTKLEEESKYILTFKEQALAAKYLVRIIKADDEEPAKEFELNQCIADISEYVVDNGIYRIYVQALATEGSFYTDSATSGNPYRLVKGETLELPKGIIIDKNINNNEVRLSWNSVENSTGYQIYIYYNQFGESLLRKSIFVQQSLYPSIDIGSGEYNCLIKEGNYSIQIKALGDDELYENSQTATIPYVYKMETEYDFNRNTIFLNGSTYSYYVESIDQLKNLLWYHYLYNQDVWDYDTSRQYNFKAYMVHSLDDMVDSSKDIPSSVADEVHDAFTNAEKMNIIARALLAQYPEIINYTEGSLIQSFCFNPTGNVYIFRYEDALNYVKTETLEATNKVYGEKVDVIDTFEQRNQTYVFEIDTQESVEVTTTEQLFMALQYNKKPTFVGDCEVAKTVYENARFVLRQICSDNMNEYQKTLQIYDFLTKQIAWNNVAGDVNDVVAEGEESSVIRGNLKDFYLEGIFYNFDAFNGLYTDIQQFVGNSADSEALSKAFVVLCSIEGIDAIKVNGRKTINNGQGNVEVDYSWNKVYIDIESDGINNRRWFVVDLTSAIQNTISIRKAGVTTAYQVALHKYFLMTDAEFIKINNIQATSLHKRLGDTTDYIAIDYIESTEDVNYYSMQKYSCTYRSTTLVQDATFKVGNTEDIINAMIYGSLKANKRYRVTVDVDAKEYMDFKLNASTDTIIAEINNLYNTARNKFNHEYTCDINVTIIEGRYIVITFQGENYAQ